MCNLKENYVGNQKRVNLTFRKKIVSNSVDIKYKSDNNILCIQVDVSFELYYTMITIKLSRFKKVIVENVLVVIISTNNNIL